jgi:hypothetical protein
MQGYRFPNVVGGQGQIAGGDHIDPRFAWFYAPHQPTTRCPFFYRCSGVTKNKKTFRTEGVAGVMVVVR